MLPRSCRRNASSCTTASEVFRQLCQEAHSSLARNSGKDQGGGHWDELATASTHPSICLSVSRPEYNVELVVYGRHMSLRVWHAQLLKLLASFDVFNRLLLGCDWGVIQSASFPSGTFCELASF